MFWAKSLKNELNFLTIISTPMANIKLNSLSKQFYLTIELTFKASY